MCQARRLDRRRSSGEGGGERDGEGGARVEEERERQVEENARFFETTRSRRPISTFLVRNSERERDPFIYIRVGIRRAATRFILYHIEREEGGKIA